MLLAKKILNLCVLSLSIAVVSACAPQKETPVLNQNGWSEQTWNQVYIDDTAPQPVQHDPRAGMFSLPNVHTAPEQQSWQEIEGYDSENFVMPQQQNPQYNEVMPWGQMPQKQQTAPPTTTISPAVVVNDLSAAFGVSSSYVPTTANAIYGDMSLGPLSDYHVVYYPHGVTSLSAKDYRLINNIAQDIAKQQQTYIRVVGHASSEVFQNMDPVQKKMINLEVAMQRALKIAKIFHKKGIAPEWVEIVSLGDTMPNPEPDNLKQNAADRRAEIFIQSR